MTINDFTDLMTINDDTNNLDETNECEFRYKN